MRKFMIGLSLLAMPFFTLAQSGELDTEFGTNGIVVSNFGQGDSSSKAMAIQADGKIVVIGSVELGSTAQAAISRFNTDGSIDTSFGTNGTVKISTNYPKTFGNSIAIQADGKIILGGYQWNNSAGNFVLARINEDGSFDNTFGTNGVAILDNGMDEIGKSVYLLENGQIILAGDISDQFGMVRVNANGSIDTSFGLNGWVRSDFSSWAFCEHISVSDSGNILMTGMTIDQFGDWKVGLAAYQANGTANTNFGEEGKMILSVGNDYDYGVRTAQLNDGKILVAGHSYVGSGPLRYQVFVTKLNADGSVDTSYGTNGKSIVKWLNNNQNYINDLLLQDNGKVLLCGRATDGNEDFYTIAKLTETGILDTTFSGDGKLHAHVDLTADAANALKMQTDGKLVISGNTFDFDDDISIFLARYENELMAVADFSSSNLTLYPNPTVGAIQINSNAKDFEYQIFSLSGQKLKSGKANAQEKIQVNEFAPGAYFIRINENGKQQTLRFIKK